jgi:hypothetical protein
MWLVVPKRGEVAETALDIWKGRDPTWIGETVYIISELGPRPYRRLLKQHDEMLPDQWLHVHDGVGEVKNYG